MSNQTMRIRKASQSSSAIQISAELVALLFASAFLVPFGGSASTWFTRVPQERKEVATRFGSLTVNSDKELLFNGSKLKSSVVGNNSLNLNDAMRIGETDVVLVLDNGGTACPSMYYFVTVSKTDVRATQPFGTCGDVTSVKPAGNSIRVIMPGYRGPFEPESVQLRAARQRHIFVYRGGVVTKNRKTIK